MVTNYAATCNNTKSGFECSCDRGFAGDGVDACERTCLAECGAAGRGRCSGPPEYACVCDLGWTGDACDQDCGCHGHSRNSI